jgi:hypothetical protein
MINYAQLTVLNPHYSILSAQSIVLNQFIVLNQLIATSVMTLILTTFINLLKHFVVIIYTTTLLPHISYSIHANINHWCALKYNGSVAYVTKLLPFPNLDIKCS